MTLILAIEGDFYTREELRQKADRLDKNYVDDMMKKYEKQEIEMSDSEPEVSPVKMQQKLEHL